MEDVKCSFCKSGNTPENLYCADCGAPLPVLCLECHLDIPRHLGTCECCGMPRETKPLTHCSMCGAKLEDPILEQKKKRRPAKLRR